MLPSSTASQLREIDPQPTAERSAGSWTPPLKAHRHRHLAAGDRPWDDGQADPEHGANFIKGLGIALPLSVSLWAMMIWGLKAIF